MNVKGKSRAGGRELAAHLLNAEKNETVKVMAVEGTVAQDLFGAFQEMEAIGSGTRCKKPLYHAKISPDPKEPRLTPEQWKRAVEVLAKEFGVEGHAYVFVLHQKYGTRTPDVLREHGHVVFNRINPDTMLAMHDGHNYRKHELVARQLESEFGHARIQGAHIDRDGQPRPDRTPPDWSMQQATKSGVDPRDVDATVKDLWAQADSAKGFATALQSEGFTLAIGRRDLVVLDQSGDVHTLARCLGVKVAEIRARMAGVDRTTLPTVEQAREAIRERKLEGAAPIWDRDQANNDWLNTIIDAAIEKVKADPKFAGPVPEPGGREKELSEPNPEVRALATLLQKSQSDSGGRQALTERMAAFGFDAEQPGAVQKWQDLEKKVDGGRITQ